MKGKIKKEIRNDYEYKKDKNISLRRARKMKRFDFEEATYSGKRNTNGKN